MVYVSVENILYVEKIMFEILLHVIVKMEHIQQELWIKLTMMELQTKNTNFNEKI